MNPIKRLFTLIVSPNKSWGTITEDKNYTQESLSSSLLYPILGLFAIIVFFKEIEFTSERYNSGIEKAIQYANTLIQVANGSLELYDCRVAKEYIENGNSSN